MVGTIGPTVRGSTAGKRIGSIMLFWGSHSFGGAMIGSMVALMGHWMVTDILRTNRVQALVYTSCCIVLALHEARLIKLPLPQVRWQVPKRWRRTGTAGICLYGWVLGAGITTRIVSAGFYAVLLGVFIAGNSALGAVVMAVYGFARGLPVAVSALFPFQKVVARMDLLLELQEPVKLGNAAILAYMGVVLWRVHS